MVRAKSNLAVRFGARHASNMIVEVPFSYLTGFLWRFSEADSHFQQYRDIANEAKQYMLSR